MKLLHVTPAFYPATYWGGPTVSVFHLCNHLGAMPGVELRVLTTDTSGPTAVERLPPEKRRAEQYRGYKVIFTRKLAGVDFTPTLWMRIWPLVAWADVVHLTAVYSSTTLPTLLAARLLRKPVIWSPRGALQRWAGSRRLELKWLWDRLCRLLISFNRTALHVTAREEAAESAERIRSIRCVVISNGVELPDQASGRVWLPGGQLRLLYLGRLDPKKGIENLLRAVSLLVPMEYSLRICGGGDADYIRSLRELTSCLGVDARVEFSGPVDGERKAGAFFGADLCVVPSFTENFAMVVAESLAHGTPVVASTGTPWQEIELHKAGRWVSNDPETLASAIKSIRGEDLAAMGRRGREWMARDYGWPAIALRMLTAYRAIHSGAWPIPPG